MSNIHTPTDNVLAKKVLLLAITAATTAGTVVDTLGYNRAMLVFHAAPTGTGTTANCALTDGAAANGSDQAAVTNGSFAAITTVTGAQIEAMNVDLTKRQRYISASFTGAGGSAAGVVGVTVYLFNGNGKPPTQDNTPVSV